MFDSGWIPRVVDYSQMMGQHDTFRVMEIPGDPAVTSRVEVFLSSDWIAVYVDRELVQSWNLLDDPYPNNFQQYNFVYDQAMHFAIDLHCIEVGNL